MRPVKNRRRIDPRYFLEETADRDNLGDDLRPIGKDAKPDKAQGESKKGKRPVKQVIREGSK